MLGKHFWLSALERMIKTAAQVLLIIWPISDNVLGLFDVDWRKSLSIAGMAAAVSLLTSIISAPIGPDDSPSLVGEPPKQPEALDPVDTAEDTMIDPDDDDPAAPGNDEGELPAYRFAWPPSATRYDGPADPPPRPHIQDRD